MGRRRQLYQCRSNPWALQGIAPELPHRQPVERAQTLELSVCSRTGLLNTRRRRLQAAVACKDSSKLSSIDVANGRSNSHGKCVPVRHWGFLVRQKLGNNDKIAETKIVSSLHSLIDRQLINGEAGSIVRITLIEKQLSQRPDSPKKVKKGKKTRMFLLVDNKHTTMDGDPTAGVNEREKIAHLQRMHCECTGMTKGRSRRSSIGSIWIRTSERDNNSEGSGLEDQPNATESNAPRPVTPTATLALDLDCNDDIKTLLENVVNPEHPKKEDLFVADDSFDIFRSRVRQLGIDQQTQENKATAALLDKSQSGDLSSLAATTKHQSLLKRHCCPPLERAIQGFLKCALEAEDEDASIGILQLERQGGKQAGSAGKRLVPIVPSDTKNKLQKNGRRWLPKLCQAISPCQAALDDCTISYELMLLIRHACEAAFNDVCTAHGPQKEHMDPHRMIAMIHKSKVTLNCLRLVRPFLNAEGCNPFCSERQPKGFLVTSKAKAVHSTTSESKIKRAAFHLPPNEVVDDFIKTKSESSPLEIDQLHVVLLLLTFQENTQFKLILTCSTQQRAR